MLSEVLRTLNNATEPFSIPELSRRLDLDRSVLDGMLTHLILMGKLKDEDSDPERSEFTCSASHCGHSDTCSFVAKMPKSYSINRGKG